MIDIRYEIEFWTSILRDHAKFQYISLSPKETEYIETAKQFMDLFDDYHKKILSSNITDEQVANLVSDNKTAVTRFVQFKKMMMSKLMTCDIELAMSPTFLNHMINEAMEYYRVLSIADETLRCNKVLENLRLHKVWLPDASGHAKHIASQLDGVESIYIDIACDFEMVFDKLFKKAYEMYMMFDRTGLDDGGLNQFNIDVIRTLEEFIVFLDTIRSLKANCRVYSNGTFSELIPDHMIREEEYYISKVKSLEDE